MSDVCHPRRRDVTIVMNLTEVFGMFHRVLSLSLAALVTVASSAPAQIMVRRGSLAAASNAPKMLVANPFTTNQADSAAAVAIGNGLRDRLSRHVGRDFSVVTREQMNAALAEWGYPADAILNATTSNTFAIKVPARTVVQSHLTHSPGGGFALSARLIGTNESAGFSVSLTQPSGLKLEEFGAQVADLLRPGIRALGEARGCTEQAATKPDKAVEAAQKALKIIPNHGLAEFCLGALAAKNDSTSPEALAHYRNALIGDAQSIEAYRQIGLIQQYTHDSTGVVETYQTMLRVEPTNQLLRDQAFKLFQQYNRPEAAEEVADEGIRLDPANTDWYDLKSNACLVQEKFGCAVDELEHIFTIDSTRADSSFYRKIALSARYAEDTTRFVKWASLGAAKYPGDVGLADESARAYAMAGQPDSAIAATQRILLLDGTRIEAVLRVTDLLSKGGFEQARKAIVFMPTVKANGTEDDWNTFGNIMVNAASAARNADAREAQAELAQSVLDVGATNPTLTSYAGFFVVETMVPRFQQLSQAIRANTRSCTDAQAYQELLTRFMPAARLATGADDQAIKAFGVRMLEFEAPETKAANQAVAQYCS